MVTVDCGPPDRRCRSHRRRSSAASPESGSCSTTSMSRTRSSSSSRWTSTGRTSRSTSTAGGTTGRATASRTSSIRWRPSPRQTQRFALYHAKDGDRTGQAPGVGRRLHDDPVRRSSKRHRLHDLLQGAGREGIRTTRTTSRTTLLAVATPRSRSVPAVHPHQRSEHERPSRVTPPRPPRPAQAPGAVTAPGADLRIGQRPNVCPRCVARASCCIRSVQGLEAGSVAQGHHVAGPAGPRRLAHRRPRWRRRRQPRNTGSSCSRTAPRRMPRRASRRSGTSARRTGSGSSRTATPALFTEADLGRFRAVVFLDTTGSPLNAAQEAAFEAYFRNGGGFVGVGSAVETEPDWQFLTDILGTRSAGKLARPDGHEQGRRPRA